MGNVNYQHDNSTAPGIALAHTVYGSPVSSQTPADGIGENVARVTTGSVFSNYKKPPRRSQDNGKELCASDGCRAYPAAVGKGYCVGHARSLGLIENWGREGRKHESD